MGRRPNSLAALALAAGLGCDLESAAEQALVETVATRSAEAVAAKANLALMVEVFAGEPALAAMTVLQARARAVELLGNRLRGLNLVGCEASLMTDELAGTVDATVDGCRIGLLHLDGEMHAEVEIETAPCDGGECPTAVVWTLAPFDLTLGAGNLFRPRLAGTVTLRDPVDVDGPMSWSTGDDFVIENRLGTFATRSSASWRTTDDDCVVGLQLEARLDRQAGSDDDPDADVDPKVGTIAFFAQGVDRCPGKCPSAGLVRASFGRGRVLEWDYDGRELDVVAPGGRHFTATLFCSE